jgi:hypothetical protein
LEAIFGPDLLSANQLLTIDIRGNLEAAQEANLAESTQKARVFYARKLT